jgi:hypothetical protein
MGAARYDRPLSKRRSWFDQPQTLQSFAAIVKDVLTWLA